MTPAKILVPIDFSTCAERALDYACSLAERLDATVYVVHAIGAGLPELSITLSDAMVDSLLRGNLAAIQKLIEARASTVKFAPPLVRFGDARDAILDAAETMHADLIVIGTHGRRGLSRFVLGSVAEEVLRRAPCPVLTVRRAKG